MALEMVGFLMQDNEAIKWDGGANGSDEREREDHMWAIKDRITELEGMRQECKWIWGLVEQLMETKNIRERGWWDG